MSSRKRGRPATDEDVLVDLEADPSTAQNGLCAAERKRELERNRRNLVNTRFVELEAQLAKLPGAPKRVYRRIDKEVVLKDATQALASLQRDLDLANSRLQVMTSEVNTLRSEKLELRRDKAYLHNELGTSRSQGKSLSSDNMKLWQALCSCRDFRNAVPADVSKVPVGLVLGATNSVQQSQTNGETIVAAAGKDLLQSKTVSESFVEQLTSTGAPELFPVDLDTSGTTSNIPMDDFEAACGLSTIVGEEFTKGVGGQYGIQSPNPLNAFTDPLSLGSPNIAATEASPDVAPCG